MKMVQQCWYCNEVLLLHEPAADSDGVRRLHNVLATCWAIQSHALKCICVWLCMALYICWLYLPIAFLFIVDLYWWHISGCNTILCFSVDNVQYASIIFPVLIIKAIKIRQALQSLHAAQYHAAERAGYMWKTKAQARPLLKVFCQKENEACGTEARISAFLPSTQFLCQFLPFQVSVKSSLYVSGRVK